MAITITLKSGRVISCFDAYGNVYYTHEILSENDFARGELSNVVISGELQNEFTNEDGTTEISTTTFDQTLTGAKIALIKKLPDNTGTKFGLYTPNKTQRQLDEANAMIKYLAMMADIDLEA